MTIELSSIYKDNEFAKLLSRTVYDENINIIFAHLNLNLY